MRKVERVDMMPKSLEDLKLYQECRKFIIIIYRLSGLLPKEELYGLVSQIRRAVVSVLANLVEGYGRQTRKDQLHFYNISLSSFREVECYIIVFYDLEYISHEQYVYATKVKDKIGGMLINFIKSKK